MPQRTVVVGSAQGLHARPAKLLVEAAARQPVKVLLSLGDRKPVPADSLLSVLALGARHGSTVTLYADEAEGADQALDTLAAIVAADLDGTPEDPPHAAGKPGRPGSAADASGSIAATGSAEPIVAAEVGRPVGAAAEQAPGMLLGIGVSPGQAAGLAVRMGAPPTLPAARPVLDVDAEIGLAGRALAEVSGQLRERAAAAGTATARDILLAQADLAADAVLRQAVTSRIRTGLDAPHALADAFAEQRALIATAGGYLAERAADVADLGHRALAAALGEPMPGIPSPGHPYVLIADDLSPADTSALDPAEILGIVTERGGPTSHTAILTRALGIPAVVNCPGILGADGRRIAVDGATGHVRLDVTEDEATRIRERAAQRRSALRRTGGPGRTADGHPVSLMANIGSAADLAGIDLSGVAGVGLLRTEFLFLDRTEEPGYEEQVAAYAETLGAVRDGVVIVRTLDAGADKPLPFLRLPEEPNPALGLRGIRVARRHPAVLDTQLRAIADAASRTSTETWVMAPMVSTATEAAEFVRKARAHGLATAGVMVEVPAAALHAERLLRSADFLSIGTNDLAQYTLAADRQTGAIPDLLDPWQPALLELVARCAEAGRRAGKPVGVCGEAAADPLLAPVLVGLGIRRLSMTPRGIPAVRAALAERGLADCQHLAQQALKADDAAQARAVAAKPT